MFEILSNLVSVDVMNTVASTDVLNTFNVDIIPLEDIAKALEYLWEVAKNLLRRLFG